MVTTTSQWMAATIRNFRPTLTGMAGAGLRVGKIPRDMCSGTRIRSRCGSSMFFPVFRELTERYIMYGQSAVGF